MKAKQSTRKNKAKVRDLAPRKNPKGGVASVGLNVVGAFQAPNPTTATIVRP